MTKTLSVRTNHIPEIDALKGLAILLVVLGHSIQYSNPTNFDSFFIFRFIYSFHMPLFMFLSGYVAKIIIGPQQKMILKKFYNLGIPFFAWFFLDYFIGFFRNGTVSQSLLQATIQLAKSPEIGLWFLWVLFLNFCLLGFSVNLEKRIGVLVYPTVWLIIRLSPTNYLGIGFLKWYFFFFAGGFLTRRYQDYLKVFLKKFGLILILIFPILASIWQRLNSPTILVNFSHWTLANHIRFVSGGVYQLYILTVPTLGIIFFYFVIKSSLIRRAYPILCWLGGYTLDIYVSHQMLLFGFGAGWIHVLTDFISGLTLSLLLSIFVLRRVPILNTIFLGNRSTTRSLIPQNPSHDLAAARLG
jgi:fucose 4-O-acetylase-like acetyltransferase